MFIQSAELTAAPGKSGELGPMVTKARDILSSETGKPWSSWAVMAGRPFGTYLVSTRADGFADMLATQMKLVDSEAWAAASAEAGGASADPAKQYLAEVIAMTGEPAEPKQLTTVTRATMSGGSLADSVAWSCAAMEHATKSTGQVGTVATSVAGGMFEVYWFAGSDTAEELDAARQTMSDDAEYQAMIAQAGADGLFIEGSVEATVLFRMP